MTDMLLNRLLDRPIMREVQRTRREGRNGFVGVAEAIPGPFASPRAVALGGDDWAGRQTLDGECPRCGGALWTRCVESRSGFHSDYGAVYEYLLHGWCDYCHMAHRWYDGSH